jgi:excisionase family DNA binding protein
VLTGARVTDKLPNLVERLSDQLSLPLFESDSEHREQQSPCPAEPKPERGRRVVSGRSLTPRAQASAELPSASSSPGLLTTSEAAALLHVHPRTVQRLVERGELGVVRLGAAVRFDPADVAGLTTRLKRREAGEATPQREVVGPSRPARTSFADRLRSQRDEHRAA